MAFRNMRPNSEYDGVPPMVKFNNWREIILAHVALTGQAASGGREAYINSVQWLFNLTVSKHDPEFLEKIAPIEERKSEIMGQNLPPETRDFLLFQEQDKLALEIIRLILRKGYDEYERRETHITDIDDDDEKEDKS